MIESGKYFLIGAELNGELIDFRATLSTNPSINIEVDEPFLKPISKPIEWNMSMANGKDRIKELFDEMPPSKFLCEIELNTKIKIKGKQYARPFYINKKFSNEFMLSDTEIKNVGDKSEYTITLTGIKEDLKYE